jgi:UDP-N-acetylmuramate: L-alanyl-gamma-D-glutamyl-meso-diaminopimelate ligase
MRIHFIAIGGSAMHNLAIALHKKGYHITGSDDEIFEPSRSRLRELGLLPEEMGWFPEKLEERPDAVILGMHARAGNPELEKARELGIRVYSYPEYLYEHAKNKKRVVIGGSHGKTTITAIILHVLKHCGLDTDYMVGAQLTGFDVMVKLTDNAGMMVLEGDEYLTSAEDRRPKFHIYRPNVALLSGIAWDHINVFPTWEGYIKEFEKFVRLIEPGGSIVYCREDIEVVKVAMKAGKNVRKIAYGLPDHYIKDGVTRLMHGTVSIPLKVFGIHNLLNIEGARMICKEIGVKDDEFYSSIGTFPGAANRLELVAANSNSALYRDFAHSPSKLKATVNAVKLQFPERKLVACMELHTFSSLSENFLDLYRGTLDSADIPIVYYNPHTIELKRLPVLDIDQVKLAFNNKDLAVYTDSKKLRNDLGSIDWKGKNLLMMSSGNFDNIPMNDLVGDITGR